jgi:hypothetical protein
MRSLAGCPIFLSGFATPPCLAIMLAATAFAQANLCGFPPVEGLRRGVRELMEDFDARLLASQG